MKIVLNC